MGQSQDTARQGFQRERGIRLPAGHRGCAVGCSGPKVRYQDCQQSVICTSAGSERQTFSHLIIPTASIDFCDKQEDVFCEKRSEHESIAAQNRAAPFALHYAVPLSSLAGSSCHHLLTAPWPNSPLVVCITSKYSARHHLVSS